MSKFKELFENEKIDEIQKVYSYKLNKPLTFKKMKDLFEKNVEDFLMNYGIHVFTIDVKEDEIERKFGKKAICRGFFEKSDIEYLVKFVPYFVEFENVYFIRNGIFEYHKFLKAVNLKTIKKNNRDAIQIGNDKQDFYILFEEFYRGV